jgi:hypothetical protein
MRHATTYIVYLYQYNTMRRPAVDAVRRTYHNGRDLDSLPPTVIRWANIAADSKREALRIGRPLVTTAHEHSWER